ncbi:type I restriction-modification system subunit M N-terminal domain-containing protein [Peribacillus frigoritolerans]|uniref:type I restriction-modification system subunit M N-terminal domain-containing protein n=1 Tax=Peribacillus frigoritolerans TaxID=450367 RepID=UPI003F6C73FD
MFANDYKSYLLGLVFYKYLSDKMFLHSTSLLEETTTDLTEAQRIYIEIITVHLIQIKIGSNRLKQRFSENAA